MIPSAYKEGPYSGDPCRYAVDAAVGKVRWVAERYAGVVIGADTVVVIDGEMLGKPASDEDARTMLGRLSARTHTVYTGVCVINTALQQEKTLCEATDVTFRSLSNEEIVAYLETGEYRDKAGAYGIQGEGGGLVEGVVGEITNVIGLPLSAVAAVLREMGVPV